MVEASELIDSSVLSASSEVSSITGGSSVRGSVVQWSCSVDQMAIVQESMMCVLPDTAGVGCFQSEIL